MSRPIGLFAVCMWMAVGLAAVPPVSAQTVDGDAEPAVPEKVGKELHAFRIRGTAPRIDGRLDDEAWQAATPVDDLVQDDPDNMQPPTERTVVQIAYNDRYLYIAVHCFASDPSQIRTGLGRRDNVPSTDVIAVSFDPRHDRLTSYVFRVNASGCRRIRVVSTTPRPTTTTIFEKERPLFRKRPNSFEFDSVTLDDDPDFNRKSLRSTVVLRWEYIRSITLFVVWNLSTSDTSRPGVFSPVRDLRSAFGAPGSNVVAVKINYWLAP